MFQIKPGDRLLVRDDLVHKAAYTDAGIIDDEEVHDTDEDWARAIDEVYALRGQYVTVSSVDSEGWIECEETDDESWGIMWRRGMFALYANDCKPMHDISQDSLFDLILQKERNVVHENLA